MQATITIPARGNAPTVSIPYRRDTIVQCDLQRTPGDLQDPVHFSIEGSSPQNGTATIVGPDELTDSGTLRLHGNAQTLRNHSGHLRVRASFNGIPCGHSAWFSVCAHPVGVINGPECAPHVTNEDGIHVGMYISIGVVSDSGVTADLDQVSDQERVSGGRDQSALLVAYVVAPVIAGAEPAHLARFDRHRHRPDHIRLLENTVLRGQAGEWSNDQLDVFVCGRCTMQASVAIPNSGYRITRRIWSATLNRLRFSVTKTGRGCTVDQWSTGSGPSDSYSVTLDVEWDVPNEAEQVAQQEIMPVLRR